MGNEVQAVNGANQAQPSTTKRVAVTLAPLPSAIAIFTKELFSGKNVYDAGKQVKQDFNSVHDANKQQMKDNVRNAAQALDDHPVLGYGTIGFLGIGIKALDKAIN